MPSPNLWQVTDWGLSQCLSLHVAIRILPVLQVEPARATLVRGEAVRIRCLAADHEPQSTSKFAYSWTRNGKLFQSERKSVIWEDLYPDGSILKISSIQKSAEYTCIVSNSVKPVTKNVYLTVIDRNASVRLCPEERVDGILWSSSAPGGIAAISKCPYKFYGYTQRVCEQRANGNSIWLNPDYSHCIHDQLQEIREQFESLTHGYQRTSVYQLLTDCLIYTNVRFYDFRPGEANHLINLLQKVFLWIVISSLRGIFNGNIYSLCFILLCFIPLLI